MAGDDGDRLTDEELRDQLVTLLLAGHETTATALAWALYELGRDPDAARPCPRGRAATDDDAYLEAVLKESMRLHPVIPMVVRHPDAAGDARRLATSPRGATVGPSILVSHARDDSHPDPERFDPTRFLGQNPPVNTWIPFGGGVRRCIGAGFSLMEGVAVLREILTAYDVTAAGPRRTQGPQHHQRAAARRPDRASRPDVPRDWDACTSCGAWPVTHDRTMARTLPGPRPLVIGLAALVCGRPSSAAWSACSRSVPPRSPASRASGRPPRPRASTCHR